MRFLGFTATMSAVNLNRLSGGPCVIELWKLTGIGIVVLGFGLRVNPLIVIAGAAGLSGWTADLSPVRIIEAFGHAFAANRFVSVAFLVLPVIGILERHGLQERAKIMIAKLRGATAGRLLLGYLLMRQTAAAIGLTSLGGHATMVRPLLAPMVEGAAEIQTGTITEKQRYWLRAHAAAADNIGLFFGEDIFIAIGSILLIKGFLETYQIIAEPLELSLWAIPTAIFAALIHGTRILLIDRRLKQEATRS